MMRAVVLLAIVIAVIASGCMVTEPGNSPGGIPGTTTLPEPVAPDLLGTWTGTMNGYDASTGFNPHDGGVMLLTVTGQRGRIFAGNLTITEGTTTWTEPFAGTIGRDGRTLTIVEESGYCTGGIIGPDEIELVYANDGLGFSISIDSLRR
ncbi:MAG TPA: hypothetical protein P5217_05950 [Methanoregulaceae archaeon]|nr:hypothetical protein [Methanoregulaceae archaeon]HPD75582.1 hypothetical protein [Methanoregulaceae archaeon]HRY75805.1 hypothetical protein [Methanoregulaceae archaeon]